MTTCGTGFQPLIRKRIKEATCGGTCPGGEFNFKPCNNLPCVDDW